MRYLSAFLPLICCLSIFLIGCDNTTTSIESFDDVTASKNAVEKMPKPKHPSNKCPCFKAKDLRQVEWELWYPNSFGEELGHVDYMAGVFYDAEPRCFWDSAEESINFVVDEKELESCVGLIRERALTQVPPPACSGDLGICPPEP